MCLPRIYGGDISLQVSVICPMPQRTYSLAKAAMEDMAVAALVVSGEAASVGAVLVEAEAEAGSHKSNYKNSEAKCFVIFYASFCCLRSSNTFTFL